MSQVITNEYQSLRGFSILFSSEHEFTDPSYDEWSLLVGVDPSYVSNVFLYSPWPSDKQLTGSNYQMILFLPSKFHCLFSYDTCYWVQRILFAMLSRFVIDARPGILWTNAVHTINCFVLQQPEIRSLTLTDHKGPFKTWIWPYLGTNLI